MPTTPRRELPYPRGAGTTPPSAPPDPVNVPGDLQRLAEALDNVAFDMRGLAADRPPANAVEDGTYWYSTDTGELDRSDAVNWAVIGNPLAILRSLIDAKGDLIVGTADNAVARLAVGPDGQILTADAAQAAGVKWAPPAGGGGVYTGAAFPAAPTEGMLAVRTDQPGDPMYKYVAGAWELQPRMGAQTVPACRLRRSAVQSIPSGAETAISFDVEDFDTNTMHDPATNATRLTIVTPGVYDLKAVFAWASSPGLSGQFFIKLNGSAYVAGVDGRTFQSMVGEIGAATVAKLAAGDYLELVAYQNTGGAINAATQSQSAPALSAVWLGGPGQTVDERGVPATRLGHSVAQNVPTDATTVLTFDTERYDTDGMHDPAVNASRITIKTPGLYTVSARVFVPGTPTNALWDLTVSKNGVGIGTDRINGAIATTNGATLEVNTQVMCAAGDYLTVALYQGTGATLAVGGAGETLLSFAASLVGSGKTVTPFARGTKSAAQSIPHNTVTTVAFESELADNDGIHDTAVNTSRFTCRTAGVYALASGVSWSNNANGVSRSLYLRITRAGGAVDWRYFTFPIMGNSTFGAVPMYPIADVMELAVGDYVELLAWQDSGGAINVGSDSFLSLVKVGAPNAPALIDPGIGAPNVQAANYQLVLDDAGKAVEMNAAGATVLTVPADATVAFPVGTVIEVARMGAGAVTVAAAAGVTIRSVAGRLALANQYGAATLRKRAANEWVLVGDLA